MATSNLLFRREYTAVLTTGDNQYNDARTADFRASYKPSWGRLKAKTYPTLGNHEYAATPEDYFTYFGDRVRGPAGKGWYAFNVGTWHVVALNTNCMTVQCGRIRHRPGGSAPIC